MVSPDLFVAPLLLFNPHSAIHNPQ